MKVKDFYTKEIHKLGQKIDLYVCGPTVYDSPHIGNIRPVIIFDIFNRVARRKSIVNYVHNITDIDDKIINKAQELGLTEKEISTKYELEYLELLDLLDILKPDAMPKVTQNIQEIIHFIKELIEDGFAYESNHSVYFSVDKWEKYGSKGNLSLDQLEDKEDNKDKRNVKDFSLWKSTKIGRKFKSPWGEGRPGWHTECALLVKNFFGTQGVTVHGGGIDLRFPHHTNEMAQYEADTGNDLAKNWIYVGHINYDAKKMSKSLGNIFLAKDFIVKYGADVLRMVLISKDYAKPIDLTDLIIKNAKTSLDKIKNSLKKALVSIATIEKDIVEYEPSKEFVDYLENNLDTSSAITFIFALVKQLNLENDLKRKEDLVGVIIANLKLLGFDYGTNFNLIRSEIKKAKEEHNFKELDKLKEELF